MEVESQNLDVGTEAAALPARNVWSLMAGVFTAPTQAYQYFKSKPRILVPLIVSVILMMLTAALTAQYQAQIQVDLLSHSATLPPQAMEQMRARAAEADDLQAAAIGGLSFVAMGLVGALVAWFIGSFIMGGQAGFKAMWGATVLGGLIPVVGGLLKAPLVMAKGSAYVSIGPAAFFADKDFTSIFYSLLFYYDALVIWSLIVTGIGYGIVLGMSKGKGIATAVITYALFSIILIGLSSFGLGMAGVDVTFF